MMMMTTLGSLVVLGRCSTHLHLKLSFGSEEDEEDEDNKVTFKKWKRIRKRRKLIGKYYGSNV